MSRPLRWGVRLLALAGLLYGLLLGWVWWVSRVDERVPADAIVVLGAAQYNGRPSPVLRARLDHAVRLYLQHLAPVILVTGGVGAGDRTSEARVGERYLQSRGVPLAAVVVRPEGRTTEESMRSVGAWMREQGHTRLLLVSDPFHMARLRLEARRLHLVAYTSPTESSPIVPWSRTEVHYLAAEALKLPVAAARILFSGSVPTSTSPTPKPSP